MSTIASLPSAYAPRYASPTYASPARHAESDESCSDDGSVGPRDFIAPAVVKPAFVQEQKQQQHAVAPLVAPRRFKIDAQGVEALAVAMSYLPLADLETARAAGGAFAAAVEHVAPKPLPCDEMVFVRWEPQELRTTLPAPKVSGKRGAQAPPPIFPWRCLSCGNISAGPRACNHCRAPLASSACRVFMGQLRKDLSAELATAMVRCLAPDVTILHMESHTNGADGRGKGCTWAYVNSVEDALRLVALHKRVFIDRDADGFEGYWFVEDAALKPQLAAFADVIGAGAGRPAMFPRQPLVAELPSKSMLGEYVASVYGPAF